MDGLYEDYSFALSSSRGGVRRTRRINVHCYLDIHGIHNMYSVKFRTIEST